MVKKVEKMILITLMFIVIFNIFEIYNVNCRVFAFPGATDRDLDSGGGGSEIKGGIGAGNTPLNDVNFWKPEDPSLGTNTQEKLNKITGTIQIIGIILSVGTLSVIGVKFMLGSVEEKAQYKQTLAPWLIGAVLIFTVTTLPSLIYTIVHGIFKGMI